MHGTVALCGRKKPLYNITLHFKILYTTGGDDYLANYMYREILYGLLWMTFWPCGITGIINVVQVNKTLCCGFK